MKLYPCSLTEKIALSHPLILASGISGNSDVLLARAALSGAAAVTTKGVTLKYRRGAENPVSSDWGAGLITNLGLTNPGVASMVMMIQSYRKLTMDQSVPIFANIHGDTAEEFAAVASKIVTAEPDMLEMDIPVLENSFLHEAVSAVKENAAGVPLSVKLSPACCNIAELAATAEQAGADVITAINPVSGMLIDAYACRPFLSSASGWLSGPCIKPIALQAISEIYQAVHLPIIGMGGILTGLDMVEMMLAGATAVGIGSALYYQGYDAFQRILTEFDAFMVKQNIESVDEIIGKIWRNL